MNKFLLLAALALCGCQATIHPDAPSRLWTDTQRQDRLRPETDVVRIRLAREGLNPLNPETHDMGWQPSQRMVIADGMQRQIQAWQPKPIR